MICPNIRWFHPGIAILAICNGVPWKPLHPGHLPHSTTGILDEPELRLQVLDKLKHVLIHLVTELCVLADRVKEMEAALEKRPQCEHCGEYIQDDYTWEIDGKLLCPECAANLYRKQTEDFMP